MTIDIVSVKVDPLRDAYVVTGQVGSRQESVTVTGLEVSRALAEADAKRSRREYDPSDLVPFIAAMATPELAAAFSL